MLIDLTPLSSTLSLEAGVVGIALTNAGEVEACRTDTWSGIESLSRVDWRAAGDDLLTVPPEVTEGSTET